MKSADELVVEFLANPLHPVALLEVLHGEVRRQQNNLAAAASCESIGRTNYPREYHRRGAEYRAHVEHCRRRLREAEWLLEFVGSLPEVLTRAIEPAATTLSDSGFTTAAGESDGSER